MNPIHRMAGTGIVLLLLLSGMASGQTPAAITLDNAYAAIEVAPNGQVTHFLDKATGTDYLAAPPAPFAQARKNGQAFPVSAVTREGDHLLFQFGDSGLRADIKLTIQPHYFLFEVLSVTGDGIEELLFFDIPLTLKGRLDEPFAACTLALNLKTNVPEIPGPNSRMHALCYPRFGLEGAKAAVIACPQPALRGVMKEVVSAADELPHSNIGGPWALDGEINRGSYLFDFGACTEKTVDDWIRCVKTLGLNQIDFHTGTSLRFGDCLPNPTLFPNGRASVKAVIDKLHAAGISAGLHTYAFFIAKNAKYVTPTPDPRLGKDATYTLAEALSTDTTTLPVLEDTKDVSTITGFFVHNSITLQIDDELITYGGASKEPPYAFTGCVRGALGTTAAPHEKGAKAYHLKECFGLFCPDADSTLLTEVAENAASTFNECGFDMMYLDALDGEGILAGNDLAWHYGSKFVFDIATRLNKPALFEMSTFHHHLWYVRARMGAWDHPTRSHKRFIDEHVAANQGGAGMFLPMNLGWWSVQSWSDGPAALQKEPTYPDDIEYLMTKCLASDSGISLMGVNPDSIDKTPAYQRLAPIFRQYEDLRHAKYFPETIKEKLRAPGEDFTLEQAPDGAWRFRPAQYDKHKVQGIDGWSNHWTVKNRFAAQPAQFRIEALMAAAPYDAPEGTVIEDFSKPETLTTRTSEKGVTSAIETSTQEVKTGSASGCFTALSDRPEANGAWTQVGKQFTPSLSIADKEALGMWVHGDGKGELLNVQMRSPQYTANGGIGDHYVTIDFTGWRYVELMELEGGHILDYRWPYGGGYSVYRESVDFNQVDTLSFWYNQLPQNEKVCCYLSPLKALPLKPTKLINPQVTLGGKTLRFPVEIETGAYLEFHSLTDCRLYDPNGALLSEVKPEGEIPTLLAGENSLEFTCESPEGTHARARVVTIARGEPL